MAEELYYNNVYLADFKANVLSVIEKDGLFHVVLDKTAFYPEGGGQPSDIGTIDGIEVIHVYEENGKIYHVARGKIKNYVQVNSKLDWNRRFDLMQQHLGQHILFACGKRVLNIFREKCMKIDSICTELIVNEENIEEKLIKITKNLKILKEENKFLTNRLLNLDVENYLKSTSIVCGYKVLSHIFNGIGPDYIKELSTKLLEREKTIILLGVKNEHNAQLLFGSNKAIKKIDISDIFKQSIGIIKGKGGGNRNYAQGSGSEVEMLKVAIDHAYEKIVNVLKEYYEPDMIEE